jgi:hypothetical protein|tara:strand:- start:540 stop:773 length:234 start_codon:yes stop_codon:yes gene_type:complete
MFKVLLIMTTMSGASHQVGFENINECLEARNLILEQAIDAEVICLPMGDKKYQTQQMDEFFDRFMIMVEKIKNSENR